MALTFNDTLKTTLDGASSKLDWANKLQTALTATRRLRCYHDANAQATDPSATGTEFLNVGSSGALTIVAGSITGFGTLQGMTTHVATDLSTGAAVLRLEGGGNWVQGTLGLAGSNADFVLSASLTTAAGVAFDKAVTVKPPRLLPSGTGPVAPPIKSTTPSIIELVDWTDPNNPVVVGTATFTTRQDDFVFQDAEMAAEIGDVAVYQLNDTIKWMHPEPARRFELGGLLLIAANYNTEGGTTQLEQMLLSFKPYGRWATYPGMDTFIRTTHDTNGNCTNAATADRTNLPPFKVNLKAADGTVIFTHEWKAFNDKPTLPINSPLLAEQTTHAEPGMPRFNCGCMLPWQNMRTRLSSKAGKYFAGVDSFSYDGNAAPKEGDSCNPYAPLAPDVDYISGDIQPNSAKHFYAMPAYPLKADYSLDSPYLTAYESRPRDPGLFPNRDHYPFYRQEGYKYQPGSMSGHDWVTGVGGSRFDRAAAPTVLAIYASNQNWVRPEGNVPIRDMVDGWGMAYFNHPNHWVRNVLTFDSMPKADMLAGKWIFVSAYYGHEGEYAPLGQPNGPQVSIDVCSTVYGEIRQPKHNDPEGYMYYAGWCRDALHSYTNAAWWAIMLNSPMHAIAAKHDFDTQWMCAIGGAAPTKSPFDTYGIREGAWRFLAYTLQWKVCADHPLTYTRENIEARFQIELEKIYDLIYKPAFIDNDQSVYSACIRNLGVGCATPEPNGGNLTCSGGSLGWYMVHVLFLMRQVGLWSVMKNRSAKCKAVLEMMIRNLDLCIIDYSLDTDCRDIYYQVVATGKTTMYTAADIPANWAAQKVMLDTYMPYATTASQAVSNATSWKDMFITWDNRAGEHDGCPHLLMQYLKGRAVYFPEYPAPRLQAAITKVQGYYDAYEAKRQAGLAYKMRHMYAGHGVLLPPTEIGPN